MAPDEVLESEIYWAWERLRPGGFFASIANPRELAREAVRVVREHDAGVSLPTAPPGMTAEKLRDTASWMAAVSEVVVGGAYAEASERAVELRAWADALDAGQSLPTDTETP